MPRKSKGFKSKLRDAAKASRQGKMEEANKIWQEITLGIVIVFAVGLDMWKASIGRGFSRLFRRT
jgi:hypothetical protein